MRAENKSIFTGVSSREFDFLSNLVKHSFLYGLTGDKEKIQVGCVYTLGEIFHKQISNVYNLSYLGDYFHLLIYLCCSMPYLFFDNPDYKLAQSLDIRNLVEIFKIILQFQCSQIIFNKIFLSVDLESIPNTDDTSKMSPKNSKIIDTFYKYLLETMVYSNEIKVHRKYVLMSPEMVYATLKDALMPFLRCSSLFFYCLNDLKPISTNISCPLDDIDKKFENLIEFFDMSMDNFFDLLDVELNGFNKIILNK